MKYKMIAEHIILQLKQMEVDVETMEYIIEQVGMKDQILHQLKNDCNVTRFEVINHAKNDMQTGRIMTLYKETMATVELNGYFKVNDIELLYQDEGKTLKVFLG
jgi:hypothetical protein